MGREQDEEDEEDEEEDLGRGESTRAPRGPFLAA